MASDHVAANESNNVYVAVPLNDPDEALSSLTQKLNGISPLLTGKDCCIYKVPVKFRKVHEKAYTPEIVSIGPFHHGKIGLLDMEVHKLQYMKMLLDRTGNPKNKLKECVDSIRSCEEDAGKCYSEPITLDSGEFVEMVVTDGLFIIELLGKSAGILKVDSDDIIFNNVWSMPSLIRDMILLENQIPMFVVQRLFEIVKDQKSSTESRSLGEFSLNELALRFFDPLMKREEEAIKEYFDKEGAKHFLDLLSKTFHVLTERRTMNTLIHLPCVTELRRAGVKFKKGSSTGSFLDIKFAAGVMTIPPILVQDQTDILFRNLIAFEQCSDRASTYISSYVILMDSLIESPNDVTFLRRSQIITNRLGHDKDVSVLFSNLCNEVSVVNLYYSKLYEDVNKYYSDRQRVINSYCGNILLLLTLTATVFAMLSFFVHKS